MDFADDAYLVGEIHSRLVFNFGLSIISERQLFIIIAKRYISIMSRTIVVRFCKY